MYDLSKLVSQNNDVEVKGALQSKTPPDPHEYELVDRQNWEKIPKKTFIRYQKKDGAIPRGGFVRSIWRSSDETDNVRIELSNGFGANSLSWNVFTKNLDKIWRKIHAEEEIEVEPEEIKLEVKIKELKKDVDFCRDSIEQIKIEIQKINNEQIRVVKLIKKLHNLK